MVVSSIPPPASPAPRFHLEITKGLSTAVMAASMLIGALAITSQSYWTGEAASLVVAMGKTPAEALKNAQVVGGAALESPIYNLYLFAWHKIFGSGEWAMRASNLPWFALAQLAFLILLRHKPRLAVTACLLSAFSPVVWMYLDETRAYLLQYAAACWLAAGIVRLTTSTEPPNFSLQVAGVPLLLLFSSSPLGALWACGFLLAFSWLWFHASQKDEFVPELAPLVGLSRMRWQLVIGAVLLLAFAAYYFITWKGLETGETMLKQFTRGVMYVTYEFFGFSGFGPGKLELRTAPIKSILKYVPALLPLVACIILLGAFMSRHLMRQRIPKVPLVAWLLALALPGWILLTALFFMAHRPLPRQFLPALPALILGLAAIMQLAFASKSTIWRFSALALPVLWLGSSLNLRWHPMHAKDDYRNAATLAAAALRENKEVWWAADSATAFIYLQGLKLADLPGRLWTMHGPDWNDIRFKFPPRVIIISKPDIYDSRGAVARYAAENQFVPVRRLPAFTILARPNDPLPKLQKDEPEIDSMSEN
jgi:hypothetical protein